jgi:hypothetical protein
MQLFKKDYQGRYYGNSSLIAMAQRLYRNAAEKEKSDPERKQGYQNRDQERLSNSIKRMDYSFDSNVDKAIFLDRLETYKGFPKNLRRPVFSKELNLDQELGKTKIIVDEIYFVNIHNICRDVAIKRYEP